MASSSSRGMVAAALRPIASSSKHINTPFIRHNSTKPSTQPLSSASLQPQPPAAIPLRRLQFPPVQHLPRPYGIHCATVQLYAYETRNLDLYSNFALHAANSLGIPTSGVGSPPTKRSLYTVLKGPFVHKKAQENFDRKTHRRTIKVWDAHAGVIDLWLRYLRENGIGGVGIKATVYEWQDVGFGQKELDGLEENMQTTSQKVAEAAKQLQKDLEKDIAAAAEIATEQTATKGKPGKEVKAEKKKAEAANSKTKEVAQELKDDVERNIAAATASTPKQPKTTKRPAVKQPTTPQGATPAPAAPAAQQASPQTTSTGQAATTQSATAATQNAAEQPAVGRITSQEKPGPEQQGGNDLVEGSDDVVAGQDLPAAKPQPEAAEHTSSEADGGSRGPNHS